jgi:CRP-like cAMP-binding protein
MEALFEYISKRLDINPEVKERIESISTPKKFTKGSKLIVQNQLVDKSYFVTDGCLRSYTYDKDGKEHTLQFAIKGWWISDYIAIFKNTKSTQVVECVQDVKVIEVDVDGLEGLYLLEPRIESFHRKNLERHIVNLQIRILNQLQLSSIERYNLFLSQYPDIEKHALNYHIASYLGITQQSLSRLRAEKFKK